MHTLAINGHCIALNWTNLENPNEEFTCISFYTLRAVKFSHNYCSFIVHSMIQVSVLCFHLINWWYIYIYQKIRFCLSVMTLWARVWKSIVYLATPAVKRTLVFCGWTVPRLPPFSTHKQVSHGYQIDPPTLVDVLQSVNCSDNISWNGHTPPEQIIYIMRKYSFFLQVIV